MKKEVKEIIALVLEINPEQINDNSISQEISNWDSLNHMNIIFAIEEKFDITFEDDELMNLKSIPSIIESIEKHKKTT
jgi:acyl carrier protein